uniref:PD-(D/E)XK endonuclease-like domain-containing protein n=1 Tax=viral metagenome TaxID=1070528 RepID=A0A6M3KNB4_9ZZZZ
MNPNMKVKEITVGLSGVIPVAAYENLRPSFSMTVEPINGESVENIIASCQQYLHTVFENESNRGKADLIDKQYSNIRFYEKNGKKYPSVTSILNWDKQWGKFTDDELSQYAARGNIMEALITEYIKTGEWIDPTQVPSLREDVSVLMGGNLMLTWEQCSHKAFMEQYKDKIEVEVFQGEVFNDEVLYAGTYDILGKFDGVHSIMDIKHGTFDMRQLAAYARCLEGIEQLVILPVGSTDNKCGYKRPVVCDTVQKEYEDFLKARAKFRSRFGI